MQKIAEDYFLFSIPEQAQRSALLLLATSGVLNSTSGRIKLFISSVVIESDQALAFAHVQRMDIKAKVVFSGDDAPVTFEAFGAPSQCFQHVVSQFETLLKKYDDSIYLEHHPEPTLEGLLDQQEVIEPSKADLSLLQHEVEHWIKSVGVNYFGEMTNLSNLTEEVGEVARLISREFGEQSFKPGERPDNVQAAIADELSDVLFIIVCLANQMGIDLTTAFARNMQKKTKRDAGRHSKNPALKSKRK